MKRVIFSMSSRSTATKYSAAKVTSTPKHCWCTWKTWVRWLAQALAMADLIRIEVHGPAAELAKLKEPLAHLKPAWFELHG